MVHRYAQRMLALSDEFQRELADGDGELTGSLVVGSSTGLGEHVLPLLLGGFRAEHPQGDGVAADRGHLDGDRPGAGPRARAGRGRRHPTSPRPHLRAVPARPRGAGRTGRPPLRRPHRRAGRAGARAADPDAGRGRRPHGDRGGAAPRRRAAPRPERGHGAGPAGVGQGGRRGRVRGQLPVAAGRRAGAASGGRWPRPTWPGSTRCATLPPCGRPPSSRGAWWHRSWPGARPGWRAGSERFARRAVPREDGPPLSRPGQAASRSSRSPPLARGGSSPWKYHASSRWISIGSCSGISSTCDGCTGASSRVGSALLIWCSPQRELESDRSHAT